MSTTGFKSHTFKPLWYLMKCFPAWNMAKHWLTMSAGCPQLKRSSAYGVIVRNMAPLVQPMNASRRAKHDKCFCWMKRAERNDLNKLRKRR